MAIHLIRKLEQFTKLSGEDRQALEHAAVLRRSSSRRHLHLEPDGHERDANAL
jgi:hypothetical protein